MTTVVVYDRDGNVQLKMRVFAGESILDIKQRLSDGDPGMLFVTCGGIPLVDTVPVSVLGETVVLQVDRDIEFTEINNCADVKADARQARVRDSTDAKNFVEPTCCGASEPASTGKSEQTHAEKDVFLLNGRRYVVVNRRRRVTLNMLLAQIRERMTRENLARLALCLFLFTSNNLFLLLMLLVFNILVRLDKLLCAERRITNIFSGFVPRAIFMFFASMFFIDHARYFD